MHGPFGRILYNIISSGVKKDSKLLTRVVVFEGDSVAKMYLGNWSDYETMMIEKFGKDLTPHPVKYGMLTR